MFTLGWRGLKEGTVLCSTNLRHAEEEVYLFCVTSEAGVETIYGIFVIRCISMFTLEIGSCARKKACQMPGVDRVPHQPLVRDIRLRWV